MSNTVYINNRYDRSTVSHPITKAQLSVFFFKLLMPPSNGDFERLELLDFEDSSENSSFSFFEVLRKTWVPVMSVALCVHVWKWENIFYEFMADKEKGLLGSNFLSEPHANEMT